MPKLVPDEPDQPAPATNGHSGACNATGIVSHPSPRIVGNGAERTDGERLAVNVADLDRIPSDVREMIGLAHLLDATCGIRVVSTSRATASGSRMDRPDEFAVAFKCRLLQAACLLDTLRAHDKRCGDYPTRCYICRLRSWVKLPGDAVLSLVDKDGKCRLNPKWFTIRTLPSEIIPLPLPTRTTN